MDVELLDLHDCCYARQAVVDNAVNRRSHELLQVIEKLKGEFDVIRSRERAREEECEGLREKISALSTKVKEHKLNLDKMMLEGQKWAGYQQSLLTLKSKISSLEDKKARLEDVEVSLRKEVEELKQVRTELVSKVIPYAGIELVHSDDMGSLVGRLVSSKDHTQANNDLATATFPWLDEFVADPSAPIEVLLSKKPPSLQMSVPSRTQVPLPTSQRATPSSAPVSNPMSPPAHASVTKP
ncbi:hypothetical protein Tco_1178848 [Tanacetum coccineum]